MKLCVLLVDSNTEYRIRAAGALRDKGYAVFQSDTCKAAEAILAEQAVDLLCVDEKVAGEPGAALIDASQRIRPDTRVAFLAHSDALPVTDGGGPDMLIQRPVSLEELVYKLDAMLQLVRLEREGNSVPPPASQERIDAAENAGRELKRRYEDKIPELFAEIGAQLAQADGAGDTLAFLEAAHRAAHTLNGTAGSIGFSDVSCAVHALESTLKEMIRMRRLTSVPTAAPYNLVSSAPQDRFSAAPDGSGTLVNVLVVDDDPDFLATAVAMGKENLIRVFAASTMDDALTIAGKSRLDAAVIDIILDGPHTAFEIAAAIRNLPSCHALPFGFISVNTSVSHRISAVHAGASVFLDKPLTGTAFQAAVRRLIPSDLSDRAKVLVVDDDEDFLLHMKMLLSAENIEVALLRSAANIVEDVSEIRPDLILLDVVMDKVGGHDACRVLRSTEAWRDVPILMLTVYGNRKMLVDSLAAGADDFIEKPIIKEELMARIRVRLERVRMFRERADTDALTGLPTRRPFLELFKMRLAEGIRFNKPVSLCLLDLDYFKEVNDTYGHLAGDRVLAGLGLLLGSRFRTMDVRGRWGGEEFVVVFYGEDAETSKMIVNRVLEEFRSITFQSDRGEAFHVTFSAGVVSFPASGRSADELFHAVDTKLYGAKAAGRNTIEI